MSRPVIQDFRKSRTKRAPFRAFIFLLAIVIPGFFVSLHSSFFLVAGFFDDPLNVPVSFRVIVLAGCVLGIFVAVGLFLKFIPLMGSSFTRGVHRLVSKKREGEASTRRETPRLTNRVTGDMSEERTAQIASRLSFLALHSEDLHSIIVIGSAAYGIESEDSDIDIVIICRERGYDTVRDVVCEQEISQVDSSGHQKIEYTVLNATETEDLFRLASPFAYSILQGVVLLDDGYWLQLKRRGCKGLPARSYVLRSIHETVMVQYFGSIRTLQRDVRGNSCSDSCCSKKRDCPGIRSDNMLARVIMRMLYITLPSRGYMPVTKNDVIEFAGEVYGEKSGATVKNIVSMLRRENRRLMYRDYVIMKKFASRLFRETLSVAGFGTEVASALKNVTSLMRGDYERIEDRALRACVVKETAN